MWDGHRNIKNTVSENKLWGLKDIFSVPKKTEHCRKQHWIAKHVQSCYAKQCNKTHMHEAALWCYFQFLRFSCQCKVCYTWQAVSHGHLLNSSILCVLVCQNHMSIQWKFCHEYPRKQSPSGETIQQDRFSNSWIQMCSE